MLKIKPPDFQFCPFCGDRLSERKSEGTIKKYCRRDNWTYYPHVASATLAVITRPGKVLLVRRNKEPHRGMWTLPAGFLNYGELPEEALVREVKEETGLIVKRCKILAIRNTAKDSREPGQLLFFYRTWVFPDGSFENLTDKDENSEVAWKSLTNLPPIAWGPHRQAINDFCRRTK